MAGRQVLQEQFCTLMVRHGVQSPRAPALIYWACLLGHRMRSRQRQVSPWVGPEDRLLQFIGMAQLGHQLRRDFLHLRLRGLAQFLKLARLMLGRWIQLQELSCIGQGLLGLGGGWNSVSTATGGLNSIFMSSSTDGWTVGAGGIIYHFTGGGWTLYSKVGTTLNSVFMLNQNEGWAVGNSGVIYHYVSGSWSGPISPAPSSNDLRSVFMLTPSEGWIVGSGGAVLHF